MPQALNSCSNSISSFAIVNVRTKHETLQINTRRSIIWDAPESKLQKDETSPSLPVYNTANSPNKKSVFLIGGAERFLKVKRKTGGCAVGP